MCAFKITCISSYRASPKPKHGVLSKMYHFQGKSDNSLELLIGNFPYFYIPIDLLLDSSLTHHYLTSQHPRWLSMLVPGGCQARGRNSSSLSGLWWCSLPLSPLVLLSSPVYQRLHSPRVPSTEAKSEDCTCSLVAIIRKMTQQHGRGRRLLESSVKMFRAARVQT